MYPSIFGISYIHAYGFFAGVAIVASIYVATKLGIQSGLKEKYLTRLCIVGVVFGLIGGRLLYEIQNYEYFLKHPIDILLISQGGLTIYGAIILAMISWIIFIRIYKMPMLKTLDVLFVSVPLGLGIGRMGCFCAGCCYGKAVLDSTGNVITTAALAPWYAMKFPSDVGSIGPTDHYVYPAQLIEVIYNLLIFAGLMIFRKKFQKHDGQATWLFLVLYGVCRSIAEIYRGDDIDRGFFISGYLSTSQAISIPIVLFALYMLIFYKSPSKIK
ncbi:MAG: prolipoprotein diacylglyceryl transferase [Proteobacteria bacterium]|nr:prolipoprotein diacylglyceryl transferase [Pseudomonadota bacterium]